MNTENYEFHEAANLFPMMDSESFESLKKDISANGLIEPIWLHGGKIIDGRNRFNACQETGIPARFREWDGKGSLVQFVVSLNINRRHLTPSQKAAVAVEMLPMLEAEAKERMKAGGKESHANQYTAKTQGVPELGQVADSSRQPTAVRIAASAIGVSHGNISEMKRISNAAPERVEEIKQGTGISTGMCVSMLGGEMAMSGNKRELFKSGEFTITDTTHADIVADLVMTLKKVGITWASDRLAVGSLSRIVSAGHADISRLKNKIKSNPSLIQKKVNFNQFMEMWEEVYNRQVHGKKTPLTFLTNETIKERSLDLIAKLSGK